MSNPNTTLSIVQKILDLVPSAQCAVSVTDPQLIVTDGSTITTINGFYVIWSPSNSETCPTEAQVNG